MNFKTFFELPLRFAILFAIIWPLAASDLLKCESSFGETVVRLLNSRTNQHSMIVTLAYFRPDPCVLDNFEMIMGTVDRKKEYSFYMFDGFKNPKVSKPKSDITVLFAKDNVSINRNHDL
jgi:hypothetical protein